MDAIPFLVNPNITLGPLYVVHGDEAFLKRQAVRALRKRALSDDTDEQAFSTYQGDKTTFAEVFDELETMPFFYPKRVIIVENADPFVSKHRSQLEEKLAHLPAFGILILEVKTWLSTTRLAKMIDKSATIVCKAPAANEVTAWCVQWCADQYQKQIAGPAVNLLIEYVGPDMGLLDQELLKLSIYVGAKAKIDAGDVDRLVGNNRAANIWKIFDAIAVGNIQEAMAILHRLFDQGEEPMRILGAFSSELNKLALAARLTAQGLPLHTALQEARILPFKLRNAEQQMRHLGRRRLDRLYDWLLQMNLDLRGNSPLPPRTLFERFLLKLARKNEPAR